jgi:hypothetical protein
VQWKARLVAVKHATDHQQPGTYEARQDDQGTDRALRNGEERIRALITIGDNMDIEKLDPAVKAKLKGCETPEEILTLAQEEGYELSDSELEGISGGWGNSNGRPYDPCDSHNWGE